MADFIPRSEFQRGPTRSTPFSLLSLHSTSTIRALGFPTTVYSALNEAIRSVWPDGVEYATLHEGDGGWRCELRGTPWKKEGKEELESIRLILSLLRTLATNGWTILDGIRAGSTKKDTHSFVFSWSDPDQSGVGGRVETVSARDFFALSFPLADRISIIDPPPIDTPGLISSIRRAILTTSPPNVHISLQASSPSTNPNASPSTNAGSLSSRETSGEFFIPVSPISASSGAAHHSRLPSTSGGGGGGSGPTSTGVHASAVKLKQTTLPSSSGSVKIREEGWVTEGVYSFQIGGYKGLLGGLKEGRYDNSHPSLLLALLHNIDGHHFSLTTSIPLLPFKARRDILFFHSLPSAASRDSRMTVAASSRVDDASMFFPEYTPDTGVGAERRAAILGQQEVALGITFPPPVESVHLDAGEAPVGCGPAIPLPRHIPATSLGFVMPPAPNPRMQPDDEAIILPGISSLSEPRGVQEDSEAAQYARQALSAGEPRASLASDSSTNTASTTARADSMGTIDPATFVETILGPPGPGDVAPVGTPLVPAKSPPRLPPRPAPLGLPPPVARAGGGEPSFPQSEAPANFPPFELATAHLRDRSTRLGMVTDSWVIPEGAIGEFPNGKAEDGGDGLQRDKHRTISDMFHRDKNKRKDKGKEGELGISKTDIQVMRDKVEHRREVAADAVAYPPPSTTDGLSALPEIETAALPASRPFSSTPPILQPERPLPIEYIPIASPTPDGQSPVLTKFHEQFRDTLEIPKEWVGDPVKGRALRNSTEAAALFRSLEGPENETSNREV